MHYNELLLLINFISVLGELYSCCNSSCQLLSSEARRSNYEQSWFGDGAAVVVSVWLGVACVA